MTKRNNYKIDSQTLIETIAKSTSIRGVLMALGLCETGSAYKVIKRRIAELGIDISHFTGSGHLRGKTHNWGVKIPLEAIMIEDSKYTNNNRFKKRLLKMGIIPNVCEECSLSPEWNGKPLVLQLDHKNGISSDNRLENIRLLCPNCHSQTETFAGKNKRKVS